MPAIKQPRLKVPKQELLAQDFKSEVKFTIVKLAINSVQDSLHFIILINSVSLSIVSINLLILIVLATFIKFISQQTIKCLFNLTKLR